MPRADTYAISAYLETIARAVAPGAHAVVVVDGAGWQPSNALLVPLYLTLVPLPPCTPALNPIENVWACLRANRLAISIMDAWDDIVARCCDARNFFADDCDCVRSITHRDYAKAVRDEGSGLSHVADDGSGECVGAAGSLALAADGDVRACPVEQVGCEAAEDCAVFGSAGAAVAGAIRVEGDVADPVQAVRDRPVATQGGGKALGRERGGGEEGAGAGGDMAGLGARGLDAGDGGEPRQARLPCGAGRGRADGRRG
jgi:hypothetical protein